MIKKPKPKIQPNPNTGDKPPRPPVRSLYYLTLTLTLKFIIGFKNDFGFEKNICVSTKSVPYTT